jgi:hypothetical protein
MGLNGDQAVPLVDGLPFMHVDSAGKVWATGPNGGDHAISSASQTHDVGKTLLAAIVAQIAASSDNTPILVADLAGGGGGGGDSGN